MREKEIFWKLQQSTVLLFLRVSSRGDITEKVLSIGVILKELMSNTLKHAFPDRKPGTILISLRKLGGEVVPRFKDDCTWLELVQNLAVRQIRGTMELGFGPRTEFVFRFPSPE